jgi:hypothetical protein
LVVQDELEQRARLSASSTLQTNCPGTASSLKPVLISQKKSGLRQKGFNRIHNSDEEVVPPPEDAMVAQERVVQEDQGPVVVAPDPEAAEIAPKVVAPERDQAVAETAETAEADPTAKSCLNTREVQR